MTLIFYIFLSFVAYKYFRFALIDDRHPNSAPSLFSLCLSIGFFDLSHFLSLGFASSRPEDAGNLALLGAGILLGPAIAPPYFVDSELIPGFLARWRVRIVGWASGLVMRKIVAVVVLVLCAAFGPDAWIYVAFGVGAVLLQAKGAALAQSSSDRVVVWIKQTGVALLCFVVLWVLFPYTVAGIVTVHPASVGGFAGLGLGVLLSLFVSLADTPN